MTALRPSFRTREDLIVVELLLSEAHQVRPPEAFLLEVEREDRRELRAVPAVRLQKLLVVVALLVPVREQRRREVEALAVPRLRHHVHLLPDLLGVHELRRGWIADVVDAAAPV